MDAAEAKVSIREAAKIAGISETSLRRLIAAGVVEAEQTSNRHLVSTRVALDIRQGRLPADRGPQMPTREAMALRGETAQKCFDRFSKGASPVEVVIELAVDPQTVKTLWHAWVEMLEEARRSNPPRCLFHGDKCQGVLSPQASLCMWHGARARMLTEEQSAILDGKEIPTALHCTCCDKMAAKGTCAACMSKAACVVEPGRMVLTIGGQALLVLSRADVADRLAEIDKLAQPKAPTSVEMPPVPSAASIASASPLEPDHEPNADSTCCTRHLLERAKRPDR